MIRSWTVYKLPVIGVRVCVRQVSPFLPHSYSEASLPVSVFHVEVENTGEGMISMFYFDLILCMPYHDVVLDLLFIFVLKQTKFLCSHI